MPLPRVRFTVRRMIVAVAIVALIAGGTRLHILSREYNRRAMRYGAMSAMSRHHLGEPIVGYYADLSEKYERAARYPWLPVAADPPVPD